ncbi:MAG: hypothetical protein V1932_07730 [Chloroflexota bacterium]
MPIKNLSETVRLPRLGKIHLGIMVTSASGVKHPQKTDYFVCPPEVQAVFGEKPKSLRVLIPFEENETWCEQYYKSYDRTHGLVCKGDGETAMRMVDTATGELASKDTKTSTLKEFDCEGKKCRLYQAKKCGEVLNLRFMLPEVPGLGVYQIDSGSINSILNINSSADMIKRTFGRISLIPLLLTFEPLEVNNPESGKRQTVYVLNLRTTVTLAQLAEQARSQSKTLMLEAPEDYDPAELWEDTALIGDAKPTPAAEVKPEPIKPLPEKIQRWKKPQEPIKMATSVIEGEAKGQHYCFDHKTKDWCHEHKEAPGESKVVPATDPAFEKLESAGTTVPPVAPIIDMEWLKKALASIGKTWSMSLWVKENMHIEGKSAKEVIDQMTPEQQEKLKAKVNEMADLAT